MTTLKRFWWEFRAELKTLALWLLGGAPLNLGVRARGWLMPYFLKRLGSGAVLQDGLWITNPELVSIGSHCNFGRRVFITGGGGVSIGDWVGLGPDVKIWSVNHRFADPERPWQLQGWDKSPVVIEDDVWLGANVFVMPGVTVGRGAIVSAATVLTKSVPPYAIVAGNPGRVIGWRRHPDAAPARPVVADEVTP
ncbi:MAG TPA: acyltransferase [Steroidobacteraceae bacterium]|nr:acyltransferase [Steroidobacteraceae bacterium]